MLLAEEREAHCMSMQRVNYRIGIKGHLDPSWQEWFEVLQIVQEEERVTMHDDQDAEEVYMEYLVVKRDELARSGDTYELEGYRHGYPPQPEFHHEVA